MLAITEVIYVFLRTQKLEGLLEVWQQFVNVVVVDRKSEEVTFRNVARLRRRVAHVQDVRNAALLQKQKQTQ